ncbi:MAG: IdeS/Mac family cysteine endopeptidase [Akkermansia sp.]|nr:IdeS/Mac family cysteine endopeptidase [Akkermansia sp.]
MKSLVTALLACLLPPLAAAEFWASGVSAEQGWYDANKSFDPEDADREMCWAASAANIIDWWQREHADIMAKSGVDPALREPDAVWHLLRDSFEDAPGNAFYGMEWYFLDLFPVPEPQLTEYGKGRGGYYRHAVMDDLLTTEEGLSLIPQPITMADEGVDAQVLALKLRDVLESGRPLSLILGGNETVHAATLWGGVFDEATGMPLTLYLTDSDDDALRTAFDVPQIFSANVDLIEATVPGTLDSTPVLGITSFLIDDLPWYGDDMYILGASFLGFPYPVPEPTSLPLLALAALAARRRK